MIGELRNTELGYKDRLQPDQLEKCVHTLNLSDLDKQKCIAILENEKLIKVNRDGEVIIYGKAHIYKGFNTDYYHSKKALSIAKNANRIAWVAIIISILGGLYILFEKTIKELLCIS